MNHGVDMLSAVVSPLADRLAKVLMPTLETAGFADPEVEWAQLPVVSQLSARDLEAAAEELEEQGLVVLLRSANGGHLSTPSSRHQAWRRPMIRSSTERIPRLTPINSPRISTAM